MTTGIAIICTLLWSEFFKHSDKGGSVEERLYKRLHSTANFNFLFLSLFVHLLKNCSFQIFSNWRSAEPVVCSEELSCLLYKNQNKSLTLSFGERKFKFAVLRRISKFILCSQSPLNLHHFFLTRFQIEGWSHQLELIQ